MTIKVTVVPANTVTLDPQYLRVVAAAEQGPRGPAGADGAGAETWILAGNGISGGGQITSNVTIAVDNTVLRTGTITVSNTAVGINQTNPLTSLHIGPVGFEYFELETTTTTPNQIADSWSASAFRSAKYQVQTYSISEGSYEISEIFLVHDGVDVFVTEYAQIRTANPLCTFSASINAGTVRLLCSPFNARNQIKIFRTALAI